MKTDLFQSCGHYWAFKICWHIYWSTLEESSLRIWNSSAEIPSLPLPLFLVVLPKAHLSLHSRMSGFKWTYHCGYLGHENLFCIVLLCILATSSQHLLLLLGPYHFCPLLSLSLIFLKRSLVFPILLFSSISLHWSLSKAFLSLLAILWNSAFKWVYLSFSSLPLASLFSSICALAPMWSQDLVFQARSVRTCQ